MLISYPIIPTDSVNQSDEEKFNAALRLAQTQRGLYPVTTGNRWHGGIHLSPGSEPIRAIADGVIVAYRMAPDTKEYEGHGAYDTSFVLIKHETESGENTRVRFYSLYMHLKPKGLLNSEQRAQLAPFLRDAAVSDDVIRPPTNTQIWRKQVIGFGGQLYDHPTVHFEIFATDAEFAAFWRDRNSIAAGQNGSDDVFGDMHFIIPAGREFADRHPRAEALHRIRLPGQNVFYNLPVGQAGSNAARLHVAVNLSGGVRTATTYRLDTSGTILGQVGDAIVQNDYEYELYRLATALYPDCPSAGLEYLRFGRILGPDTTACNENWQLIRYAPDAIGYIDLADPANHVSVLSDADFPLRWQNLEEGDTASPTDGIANIDRLTELLGPSSAPITTESSAPADFLTRAIDPDVAATLRHLICKHPSEWDASDLEARYATMRQPGKALHDDASWGSFRQHVEAMAFWSQSGINDRSVWHFHPIQFIYQYRKCKWLSSIELARTIPHRPGYAQRGAVRTALNIARISMRTALQRTANHRADLNKTMRKYGISSSSKRQAHFLAQVMLETDSWQAMEEYGRGASNPNLPMTQYYAAFYGRGIMQLTWAANYESYGSYRALPSHVGEYGDSRISANSTHYWDDPTLRNRNGNIIGLDPAKPPRRWAPRYDPTIVHNDTYSACDSGGYYWASKAHNGNRDINRVADRDFNSSSIGRVSVLINGGSHGYYERQAYARYVFRVISDDTSMAPVARYDTARNNVMIDVDFNNPD